MVFFIHLVLVDFVYRFDLKIVNIQFQMERSNAIIAFVLVTFLKIVPKL